MNDEPQEPIEGKGYLALLLMRGLDMDYNDALQGMEYILAYCKHHNYRIKVEKIHEEDTTDRTEHASQLWD